MTPMLHRMFVAPIMEGNRIDGIITESKAGREAILAKRVIDATGDADIAHRAGALTVQDRPRRHDGGQRHVPLAGVDKRAFMERYQGRPADLRDWAAAANGSIETSGKRTRCSLPFLKKPFDQAIKDGIDSRHISTPSPGPGARCMTRGELTYHELWSTWTVATAPTPTA